MFETQGSRHFSFLADTARLTFGKYFQQLEWAEKSIPSTVTRRPPIRDRNVKALQNLRWLVHVNIERTKEHTLWSIWNPYCAGTFLTYLAHYGNIEGGTTLVDSVAQLRATLHVFNALRQVGTIKHGQLELLDWLFDSFKDCKAIWEGPHPKQGEFQTRWWISFGMTAGLARQISGQVRQGPSTRYEINRKLTPISLEVLSKSFRRICLRDFSGVVDKYHNAQQKQQYKHTDIYKHSVRVNDTLDAMESDERLLATNLICLGFYLNQFYISLTNIAEGVLSQNAGQEPEEWRPSELRSGGSISWEKIKR